MLRLRIGWLTVPEIDCERCDDARYGVLGLVDERRYGVGLPRCPLVCF